MMVERQEVNTVVLCGSYRRNSGVWVKLWCCCHFCMNLDSPPPCSLIPQIKLSPSGWGEGVGQSWCPLSGAVGRTNTLQLLGPEKCSGHGQTVGLQAGRTAVTQGGTLRPGFKNHKEGRDAFGAHDPVHRAVELQQD